jgi:KipI family sensor histidine kinase inhibitor
MKAVSDPTFQPMGDRCLIVEFESRVDPEINARVRSVAQHLLTHPIEGVVDIVPAFTTVAVHYRPESVRDGAPSESPYRRLCQAIERILARGVRRTDASTRVVEVPLCYGGELGPDLDDVAAQCRLTPQQVIELHSGSPHQVYMLGFAPGFPYLGGLDPRLETQRRSTPRTKVPAGSVAVARDQSAIYSIETPGGWNILGRTPLKLFMPETDPPCLLQPGDHVRFVPVTLEEFNAMREKSVGVHPHAAGPSHVANRAPSRDGAAAELANEAASVKDRTSVHVTKAGALSTLQDSGRFGYQRYGVIVDGVMDEWSHRVANILVGNPETEATLEMTLIGPSLRFDDAALIAICGADLSPRIGEREVPMDRPVLLRAGSQLEFGRRRSGCRAYLAIHGGYDVEPVMDSKSTYLRGGFGGFQGRALRKDDMIAVGRSDSTSRCRSLMRALSTRDDPFSAPAFPLVARSVPDANAAQSVRVIAGPQWHGFAIATQQAFLDSEFAITPNSDRMGYRLQGAKLVPRDPIEMISEGVSFGTVQVPPDGDPIILMADCQTTGGYPKIAQVASIDLPLLAQMMPGQTVRFEMISLDEAQRLYLARQQEFARILQSVSKLQQES